MPPKRSTSEGKTRRRKPATTPEAREFQMIALAEDEAERQIRKGTASSQVITHYLKLGSTRERLEQKRIEHENALLEEKKKSLESAARVEELYVDAIKAMRRYAGDEIGDDDADEP